MRNGRRSSPRRSGARRCWERRTNPILERPHPKALVAPRGSRSVCPGRERVLLLRGQCPSFCVPVRPLLTPAALASGFTNRDMCLSGCNAGTLPPCTSHLWKGESWQHVQHEQVACSWALQPQDARMIRNAETTMTHERSTSMYCDYSLVSIVYRYCTSVLQ
jgi:hypothetical protein